MGIMRWSVGKSQVKFNCFCVLRTCGRFSVCLHQMARCTKGRGDTMSFVFFGGCGERPHFGEGGGGRGMMGYGALVQ